MALAYGCQSGGQTMQVSNQIDQLIAALNELKPLLSDDKKENAEKFAAVLQNSLEFSSTSSEISTSLVGSNQIKVIEDFGWVDTNYAFDPNNPRKPNIRELMEAISGSSIEALQVGSEYWQDIYGKASEMLYGVIGVNEDTRDWLKIMSAEDVLQTAKAETGKMYEPKVEIHTYADTNEIPMHQVAVLKDKNENILRSIPNEETTAENMLRNFGATHASIPENIKDQVTSDQFDQKFLSFLENYDKKPENIDQIAIQATTEALALKIQNHIPLTEIDKL